MRLSLTTGADKTAIGFDALYSNTTDSDNALLASWNWRNTGSLNTASFGTRRRCSKTAWSWLQEDMA